MMETRNASFNQRGTIDLEINHPVYGWIPFTANPNDTGAEFDVSTFFAEVAQSGTVAEYVEPEPDPITRDQVNAERTRRIELGHAFSIAGVSEPIPLQGRAQDQTVYIALLVRAMGYKSAGITAPALIIRDAVDTTHQLTPDQMIDLVGQAMGWFEQVMAASWALKDGTEIPADYNDHRHWP